MSLKRENGADKKNLREDDAASSMEETVRWLDEDRHKCIIRSLRVTSIITPARYVGRHVLYFNGECVSP